MLCEYNIPDDQIAQIEQQYRDQITLCINGEKATVENMIEDIDTALADPRAEDPRFAVSISLLNEQKTLLQQVLVVIQSRIDYVNRTGAFEGMD